MSDAEAFHGDEPTLSQQSESGIQSMLDVLGRGISLMNELERTYCCPDDFKTEIDQGRSALTAASQALLRLASEPSGSDAQAQVVAEEARNVALALVANFSADDSQMAVLAPRTVRLVEAVGTGGLGPLPGILANTWEGIPVPDPEDIQKAIRLLQQLEEAIADELLRLRQIGADAILIQQLNDILQKLRELREALAAGTLTIAAAWSQVMLLLEQLAALAAQIGAGAFQLVDAISRFIGALVGGEAGFATVGFAIRFGLYALALWIGIKIGQWIGKRKVREKTVNEWLEDAIYLEYFDTSDDCKDVEAEYCRARAARREYENSGPTVDKSIVLPLISREYYWLSRFLKLRCFDDMNVYEKELDRIVAKLKRLVGAI
jgi:hypothetical protein